MGGDRRSHCPPVPLGRAVDENARVFAAMRWGAKVGSQDEVERLLLFRLALRTPDYLLSCRVSNADLHTPMKDEAAIGFMCAYERFVRYVRESPQGASVSTCDGAVAPSASERIESGAAAPSASGRSYNITSNSVRTALSECKKDLQTTKTGIQVHLQKRLVSILMHRIYEAQDFMATFCKPDGEGHFTKETNATMIKNSEAM